MRVVVTGSTGFVGRHTLPALTTAGHAVVAAARIRPDAPSPYDWRTISSLEALVEWAPVLAGADAVVHLAGMAHIIDGDQSLGSRYRAVNCEATLALARAAVTAGARRFVFMSSIRVHGNARPGTVFRETDPCLPSDDYGRSKLAAEEGLMEIARTSGLEVVILRPPLIYGPGVGANFLRLMRWVDRGIPLPLGGIRNRRSFLYIENLTAAIATALNHPAAPRSTFLLSDGEDLSTPELLRRMGTALGKRARLLNMSPVLLRTALSLIGRGADYQRLCGDAALDSTRIRTRLGFTPPFSIDAGIKSTVMWYRGGASSSALAAAL